MQTLIQYLRIVCTTLVLFTAVIFAVNPLAERYIQSNPEIMMTPE